MKTLVNQQNFTLGCRTCHLLLAKHSSQFVSFFDSLPENVETKYSDAYQECTGIQVTKSDGLPQRLCSDCAAKLSIAFQFKKDATGSEKILKSYVELEKNENEVYENAKFDEEENYYEYETIEELDDSSQEEKKAEFEEVTIVGGTSGGNDAVSFLTDILKPNPKDKNRLEIKKLSPKKIATSDSGFDDPNRRHCCNVCSKKFQKRSNLIDHLRLHANVKVYSCEYCEKSFVQAGNYKAHLRTHTKEKPYACHFCNKAYSQSSSLKIHIRSHTQEKNYICDICDKAFTNASDLGKHRLIHNPDKKFRCDECKRQFTQRIHLRKHLEKHHPGMDFDFAMRSSDSMLKIEEVTDGKIIFEEEFEIIEEEEETK